MTGVFLVAAACVWQLGGGWGGYVVLALVYVAAAALMSLVSEIGLWQSGQPSRTRGWWTAVRARAAGSSARAPQDGVRVRRADAMLKHPSVRAKAAADARPPAGLNRVQFWVSDGEHLAVRMCASCGQHKALYLVAGADVCQWCADAADPYEEYLRRPLGWTPGPGAAQLWENLEREFRS
jgi:hypothetical protein